MKPPPTAVKDAGTGAEAMLARQQGGGAENRDQRHEKLAPGADDRPSAFPLWIWFVSNPSRLPPRAIDAELDGESSRFGP